MVKKEYKCPELVVYGRVDQLTLGQSGTAPDYLAGSTFLINNVCDPTAPQIGLYCGS